MSKHLFRYVAGIAEAGRSRVWCGGLCLAGPDVRVCILTLVIALAIFAAQCIVSFPWLLMHHPLVGFLLLSFMTLIFVVTVVAASLTATTDPGIIPRCKELPFSILVFPHVRQRVVTHHGRSIRMNFCETCRIWRPPHSSHCSTCDNCVRRFDHHCPWIGTDIGLRNYRSYFCFLGFASLSASISLSTSVLTLHWTTQKFRNLKTNKSYAHSIRRALSSGGTSVNIVLVMLCILSLLFTGGLLLFHIHLMSNNMTTAESLKNQPRNSFLPSDDLRGLDSILFLQGTRRQASQLTNDSLGESYPEEDKLMGLIDAQVEYELHAHPELRQRHRTMHGSDQTK